MGNFHISGFYSHLPIRYGDRIGAIACARIGNYKEVHAMEPFSTGMFPIMPPVFGTYNDYGGIENVEDSYTAKIFKEVTGVDFENFVERNTRNPSITVNSTYRDNDSYIDTAGYIEIIKKLIPISFGHYLSDLIDNKLNDPAVAVSIAEIHAFEIERENACRNASFVVIFEHEAVIKQLFKTGKAGYNFVNYKGELVDSCAEYDEYTEILNVINKATGKEQNILNLFFKNLSEFANKVTDIDNPEIIKKSARLTFFLNRISSATDNALFMVLYKNAGHIDYQEFKNEFFNGMYLNYGLYKMGGLYTECEYAGQEIDIESFDEMHQVIKNIIDDFRKSED